AILGIGAAWNDDEHHGYGFEFPPVPERMERLQETLEIVKAMFTQPAPSFEGRYYRINGALNNPRPVTPGGPPILVGGSGEQRTLRLVARYADACNLFGDAPTIRHKLEVLAERCAEVGRDPAEITKTRLGTMVLRKTSEEAAQVADQMRAARGLDEEQLRAMAVVGGPDEVAEQVQPYLDAGLDGMIFNLWEVSPETAALAGEVLGGILPPA